MTNQTETPNKAQSFFKTLGSLILGWFSAFPLIGILLLFDGLGQSSDIRTYFNVAVLILAAVFAFVYFIIYDAHDRVKDGLAWILAFTNINALVAILLKIGTADQRFAFLAIVLFLNAGLFIFGYFRIVKFDVKVVEVEKIVEVEVPIEPLPEVVVPVNDPDATQPLESE